MPADAQADDWVLTAGVQPYLCAAHHQESRNALAGWGVRERNLNQTFAMQDISTAHRSDRIWLVRFRRVAAISIDGMGSVEALQQQDNICRGILSN